MSPSDGAERGAGTPPQPPGEPTIDLLLGRALRLGPSRDSSTTGAAPRVVVRPSPEPRTRRRAALRSGWASTGRIRAASAFVLLAGLAIAYFVTAGTGHDEVVAIPTAPASARPTTTAPMPPATVPDSARLEQALPAAARCRVFPGPLARAHCTIDGFQIEYQLVAAGALDAAYRDAIGVVPVVARTGVAACSSGREDERSWSRPSQPRRIAGRYACRSDAGRAAMWWTVADQRLLAHAVVPRADLASLFRWWLAHGDA